MVLFYSENCSTWNIIQHAQSNARSCGFPLERRISGHANVADIRQNLHDNEMLILSLVLIGLIAGVALIAAAVAAICRLLTKSNALSLAAGTLTIPILVCASLVYWTMTMEVDDPAPGNVLIGALMVLAAVTPVALLASRFTIKFMSSRALRNDN
jgi:hypothetical protein